ncbi:MAG: hypothetical protein ABI811_17345 [Acidobacteriota bacterium]
MIEGQPGSGLRVTAGPMVPNLALAQVLRAARYPARLVFLEDPDGNPISVNF